MNFDEQTALASAETNRVLAALPPEIRQIIADTPIFLERRPDPGDVDSGIYPDTLGLFDPGLAEAPTPRIRLWLENIWDFTQEEDLDFVDEVRVTLLHEIGHLVGWDEEALEDRGLD